MSQWTVNQLRAITARDNNLLVSAGAGAGKTAVLVERIIGRILDAQQPVDVDRLLVVTFTNAAAAEMRERVGSALLARLRTEPANVYLHKQVALLGKANITTLHSFCLDLMRQHFYRLGLDPGFRVADETETDLIKADVLEDLLEEHYTKLEDAFLSLVEGFGGRNDDSGLRKLILSVAEYALSQPDPLEWLHRVNNEFCLGEQSIHERLWYQEIQDDLKMSIGFARDYILKAINMAEQAQVPAEYIDVLYTDLESVDRLACGLGCPWDELKDQLVLLRFSRLPSKKGGDSELRESAKSHRDAAKKILEGLQKSYGGQTEAQILEGIKDAASQVNMLCNLVQSYFELYSRAKQAKGIVDFSDLEHMALQLLEQKGQLSLVAQELQDRFVEVLVDEYQDVNGVQEKILSLVSRATNRFMVGDIKQSIYGFRLAEPGVFRHKEEQYFLDSSMGECIHLSDNFRSRPAVLNAVNFLFRQLMSRSGVGGVDYGVSAQLRPGALYPDHVRAATPEVEIGLIDRGVIDEEEEEDLSVTSREARLIGKKIADLVQGKALDIWDKAAQRYRSVEYRDIVILLRATTGRAEAFVDVFNQLGIPVYADTNSGYFAAIEVMNMLNLLRVIDNPHQDIPLTGVLRSPILGFTGEELAQVRLSAPEADIWDAVLAASLLENELGKRLLDFIAKVKKWRKLVRRGGLPELIWEIYEDTGYFLYVGALPGGQSRQANLRALYHRACQYESTSFRGLFRFLRFIERLQEHNGDLGTAKTLGENEDVVRIMSIHKSKGLEFPVVFVAGLGNKFNLRDLHDPILIHKEYGLGPLVVDLEARCLYPTLPRLAIKRRLLNENLSEELRVLYVALTRAREKLYLIGAIRDRDKAIAKWQEAALDVHSDLLLPWQMVSAKCYLDWLGPACYRHITLNNDSPYLDPDGAQFCPMQVNDLSSGKPDLAVLDQLESVAMLKPLPGHGYEEILQNRFSWAYPHIAATGTPVKMSVSELKRKLALETDKDAAPYFTTLPRRPVFARGSRELTAAERGTAMHMVMQHVDLTRPVSVDVLAGLVENMQRRFLLTPREAAELDLTSIERFFKGGLGMRLMRSPKVWRELPFGLRIAANEIHSGVENEYLFIQGVIDCLFEENGKIVLLDFKNDYVGEQGVDMIADRYRTQISMYARAIRELLKREVSEAYLYLFTVATPIRIL